MCEGEIKPELFIDKEADEKWYPQKDYHRMYMGEILAILEKTEKTE